MLESFVSQAVAICAPYPRFRTLMTGASRVYAVKAMILFSFITFVGMIPVLFWNSPAIFKFSITSVLCVFFGIIPLRER